MARIALSNGGQTLVDDADLPLVSGPTWRCAREGKALFYAVAYGGRGVQLRMHRLILGVTDSAIQVDHANGDGLDNRRANLRTASASQNQQNRHRLLSRSSSPYRGVCLHRATDRWQAAIKVDGRSIYLGLYDDARLAAEAYDRAAVEFFGAFASLTFPVGSAA